MIFDYYIVRKRHLLTADLYRRNGAYEYAAGFNSKALIALAAGIGLALIGLVLPQVRWLYDYAWFVGFLFSGSIYLLLMRRVSVE